MPTQMHSRQHFQSGALGRNTWPTLGLALVYTWNGRKDVVPSKSQVEAKKKPSKISKCEYKKSIYINAYRLAHLASKYLPP